MISISPLSTEPFPESVIYSDEHTTSGKSWKNPQRDLPQDFNIQSLQNTYDFVNSKINDSAPELVKTIAYRPRETNRFYSYPRIYRVGTERNGYIFILNGHEMKPYLIMKYDESANSILGKPTVKCQFWEQPNGHFPLVTDALFSRYQILLIGPIDFRNVWFWGSEMGYNRDKLGNCVNFGALNLDNGKSEWLCPLDEPEQGVFYNHDELFTSIWFDRLNSPDKFPNYENVHFALMGSETSYQRSIWKDREYSLFSPIE